MKNMSFYTHDKGIVLLTAIFIVLLISAIAVGFLSLGNNQLEIVDSSIKSANAFYCAESGISEAILYLKTIPNWSALSGTLVSGNVSSGTYLVEVMSGGIPFNIKIKSTGKMYDFNRIIEVTLDKSVVPVKIIQQDWKEI